MTALMLAVGHPASSIEADRRSSTGTSYSPVLHKHTHHKPWIQVGVVMYSSMKLRTHDGLVCTFAYGIINYITLNLVGCVYEFFRRPSYWLSNSIDIYKIYSEIYINALIRDDI